MGGIYRILGRFEESLKFFDKAIRQSPNDPDLAISYANKAGSQFALKQYDQAVESARHAIVISPNLGYAYWWLIPALVVTGQDSQAHEALRSYLALPGVPINVAPPNHMRGKNVNGSDGISISDIAEYWDRLIEGMRKAGLPEK